MNLSVREMEGYKVYRFGDDEPCAVVRTVCIHSAERIGAIAVDTCSLIPLRRFIKYEDIDCIKGKAVYLKPDCDAQYSYSAEDMQSGRGDAVCTADGKNCGILRDYRVNAETGEITDIVISKNKISKKSKIPINKIYIKDNTIYIK